jgi:hypothetical protein
MRRSVTKRIVWLIIIFQSATVLAADRIVCTIPFKQFIAQGEKDYGKLFSSDEVNTFTLDQTGNIINYNVTGCDKHISYSSNDKEFVIQCELTTQNLTQKKLITINRYTGEYEAFETMTDKNIWLANGNCEKKSKLF